MRIARAQLGTDSFYCLVDQGELVPLAQEPFAAIVPTDKRVALQEARLLAPVLPGKVVAVGVNYREHAAELALEVPGDPLIFLKPPTAVIGPGDDIVFPAMSNRVDYEAELGVVIAKRCKDVPPERAGEYILGYTCVNDVTARDLQKVESQWARCKGFDTFCPIGPWIETQLDTRDLGVVARVNGNIVQNGCTSQMIHHVNELVSFISRVMTLLPGDVIATGTPSGIGPMSRGDVVEIEVEGIGILRNRLV